MQAADHIYDCECGLRYMRSVLTLDVAEHAQAYCSCGALIGEWNGVTRLVFDAEEPLLPATSTLRAIDDRSFH